MIRIDPYKRGSVSAKRLSRHLGVYRTRTDRDYDSRFVIINWGSSERRYDNVTYINDPAAVAIAANKLYAARAFDESGVPQPEWTECRTVASEWREQGAGVLCRTALSASGGRGIFLAGVGSGAGGRGGRGAGRVVRRGDALVDAPLYTKYVKKNREFRVHVFRGEIIDVQQKRKRREVDNDEVDYQIRNVSGGWVFCRDGVDAPDNVRTAAVSAVSALGLDFGAVDIGYNEHYDAALVYEVNTAPGLEGTTLDNYRRAFTNALPALAGGAYARRRAA